MFGVVCEGLGKCVRGAVCVRGVREVCEGMRV